MSTSSEARILTGRRGGDEKTTASTSNIRPPPAQSTSNNKPSTGTAPAAHIEEEDEVEGPVEKAAGAYKPPILTKRKRSGGAVSASAPAPAPYASRGTSSHRGTGRGGIGYVSSVRPPFDKKQTPCRWGADCKNPTCEYGHPNINKKSIPCRYGVDCTKVSCEYGHAAATHFINKQAIPCKWGAECHHVMCEFSHPERVAAGAAELPKSKKFSTPDFEHTVVTPNTA